MIHTIEKNGVKYQIRVSNIDIYNRCHEDCNQLKSDPLFYPNRICVFFREIVRLVPWSNSSNPILLRSEKCRKAWQPEKIVKIKVPESFRYIPRSCEVCGKTMFIDRDEEKNNSKFSKDFYEKYGYHAICGHRECPAYMKYI